MVLEKLGNSLRGTLDKIKNALFVDEKVINDLVKEIQKALLQSDVNVKLVFELTKSIKERALKEEPPTGITKKDYIVTIVYQELVKFLGETEDEINIKPPFKIMLVGLFGNGKTTTASKLAKYFQKRGHKIALLSTDTWRPAAFEQLKQLGEKLNVPVYGDPSLEDPIKIFKKYESELNKVDIAIIDTAGRDALNDELIEEIDAQNKVINPNKTFLVMAADLGQAAEKQAQTFHDTLKIDSVIITKLDGTAKGGGAMIACSITGAKVSFIGVGEKVDDFEKFKPTNFVGRLLGMGDIETLLEKAKEAISEDDAKNMSKKLLKGDFTLQDMYDQMEAMKKMGPLNKVMEMIPGFSQMKMPKEVLAGQEGKMDTWKYIMNSMTPAELSEPDKINQSRIDRVSSGSGTSVKDIRELLKHYKQSKKMMKMMKGSPKQMEKMMKKMGGPGMPGM